METALIGPDRITILGTRLHVTSYNAAVQQVTHWAMGRQGRYVCAANVHMVMEAFDDIAFRDVVNQADLVTPDGMPLVWMMRRLGAPCQQRVYGPALMLHICRAAEERGIPIGLYGGATDTLQGLSMNLMEKFPHLSLNYSLSPPFRPLTLEEDADVAIGIRKSGIGILFVGLGCPKQEKWMAAHRQTIPVTMVGVGAAFDFFAGKVPQAPYLLQACGMEWLFRFFMEPRRLWRRYLKHNPRFLWHSARQILRQR